MFIFVKEVGAFAHAGFQRSAFRVRKMAVLIFRTISADAACYSIRCTGNARVKLCAFLDVSIGKTTYLQTLSDCITFSEESVIVTQEFWRSVISPRYTLVLHEVARRVWSFAIVVYDTLSVILCVMKVSRSADVMVQIKTKENFFLSFISAK